MNNFIAVINLNGNVVPVTKDGEIVATWPSLEAAEAELNEMPLVQARGALILDLDDGIYV